MDYLLPQGLSLSAQKACHYRCKHLPPPTLLPAVGYPMGGYQQSFRGSTQYSFRSSTRHGSKRGSLRGSIHRNQGKGSLYNPTRVTGGSIYNPKGSFYGQQRTPQTSFYGQARTPGSSVYGGGRYKGSFRGSFRVPKGNEHPPGLEKPPGLAHAGELKPVVETNMVGGVRIVCIYV